MDGILQGVTSIAPIAPDASAISDKSVFKGPPVEIMPLPENSFNSDGAAAEQPGSATVNPNSRCRGRAQDGRQAASEKRGVAPPAGDDAQPLPEAETAYTVTLGEESAGLSPSAAKELAQMKAYQALGRALSRREPGGARGFLRAGPDGAGRGPLESEKAHVPSFSPPPGKPDVFGGDALFESDGKPGSAAPQAPGGLAVTGLEAAAGENPPPAMRAEDGGDGPAAVPPRPEGDIPGAPAALAKMRLTPTDYAAIMELEPEQRELLMKMLGIEDIRPGDVEWAEGGDVPLEEPAGQGRRTAVPDGGSNPPVDMHRRLGSRSVAPAQETTPEDGPELEAAVLRPGGQKAAPSLLVPGAEYRSQEAGMENLRKVFELPYALYMFGAVEERKRRDAEEDENVPAVRPGRGRRHEETPFLRLSEAVKMASVLHSVYHGGDGRFEEDTPWHAPYVRYAVRNGIIRQEEFGDFNRFATRAEAAHILSRSVPKCELPPIKFVGEIKDISEDSEYGEGVYLLCRAGVMETGEDGRFWPDKLITRAEAVAAAGRIATPSDRRGPG